MTPEQYELNLEHQIQQRGADFAAAALRLKWRLLVAADRLEEIHRERREAGR